MKMGILGAGQLSRMLIQASQSLKIQDLELVVLHQGTDECVRDLGVELRALPETNKLEVTDLKRVLLDLDFVTFENEFVDLSPFQALQAESSVKFFPSLDVIATLQNKLSQKRLLDRIGVPTAQWKLITGDADVKTPCVLKWARMGYDGKGTLICRNRTDVKSEFIQKAHTRQIEVYSEELVEFSKEVALVGARNWSGDIAFFPLVETRQVQGICHDVLGGDESLSKHQNQAQQIMIQVMEELNYVGVLAIEYFLTSSGQLLVNELAPRVHNSAHYSQSACSISQFDAHVLAGLDLSLERPAAKSKYFGMWNLIPSVNVDRDYDLQELPTLDPEFKLSWYYKSRLRTGRKMGHINFTSQDHAKFDSMRSYLQEWERKWNESLIK